MNAHRPAAVAIVLATFASGIGACAGGAPGEETPLGEMPTAVTTAVPEWLPPRVRTGKPFQGDAREAHLDSLRRLTDGYAIESVAWLKPVEGLALFGRAPGSATMEAMFYDLKSGEIHRSSGTSATEPPIVALGASPDAARVAFITESPAGRAIQPFDLGAVLAAAFTGKPMPSPNTAGLRVEQVGVSPTDGRLFFVAPSGPAGALGLYATRDTGPPSLLVPDGVESTPPAISPNRAYLAWVKSCPAASGKPCEGVLPGERALVVSSIEGRSPRSLTSGTSSVSRPVFMKKGERVAFASDRDAAGFELYRADAFVAERAALPERLTFSGGAAVAFSPDGRAMAFTSRRGGATLDLYVARWIEEP